MSEEEMTELKAVFKTFDKDGDGTIDVEELGTALRSLGQNPTKEEVKKLIDETDKDGSGCIEFDEFAKMMAQRSARSEDGWTRQRPSRSVGSSRNGWKPARHAHGAHVKKNVDCKPLGAPARCGRPSYSCWASSWWITPARRRTRRPRRSSIRS